MNAKTKHKNTLSKLFEMGDSKDEDVYAVIEDKEYIVLGYTNEYVVCQDSENINENPTKYTWDEICEINPDFTIGRTKKLYVANANVTCINGSTDSYIKSFCPQLKEEARKLFDSLFKMFSNKPSDIKKVDVYAVENNPKDVRLIKIYYKTKNKTEYKPCKVCIEMTEYKKLLQVCIEMAEYKKLLPKLIKLKKIV